MKTDPRAAGILGRILERFGIRDRTFPEVMEALDYIREAERQAAKEAGHEAAPEQAAPAQP
jgi:hypothetical protein